ncbi:unnamed protein product [Amoebophrya sp. A25]|nr:unnamed protein product [Amoebophrya sp. A25]|eukprot:GSA25T00026630001.1
MNIVGGHNNAAQVLLPMSAIHTTQHAASYSSTAGLASHDPFEEPPLMSTSELHHVGTVARLGGSNRSSPASLHGKSPRVLRLDMKDAVKRSPSVPAGTIVGAEHRGQEYEDDPSVEEVNEPSSRGDALNATQFHPEFADTLNGSPLASFVQQDRGGSSSSHTQFRTHVLATQFHGQTQLHEASAFWRQTEQDARRRKSLEQQQDQHAENMAILLQNDSTTGGGATGAVPVAFHSHHSQAVPLTTVTQFPPPQFDNKGQHQTFPTVAPPTAGVLPPLGSYQIGGSSSSTAPAGYRGIEPPVVLLPVDDEENSDSVDDKDVMRRSMETGEDVFSQLQVSLWDVPPAPVVASSFGSSGIIGLTTTSNHTHFIGHQQQQQPFEVFGAEGGTNTAESRGDAFEENCANQFRFPTGPPLEEPVLASKIEGSSNFYHQQLAYDVSPALQRSGALGERPPPIRTDLGSLYAPEHSEALPLAAVAADGPSLPVVVPARSVPGEEILEQGDSAKGLLVEQGLAAPSAGGGVEVDAAAALPAPSSVAPGPNDTGQAHGQSLLPHLPPTPPAVATGTATNGVSPAPFSVVGSSNGGRYLLKELRKGRREQADSSGHNPADETEATTSRMLEEQRNELTKLAVEGIPPAIEPVPGTGQKNNSTKESKRKYHRQKATKRKDPTSLSHGGEVTETQRGQDAASNTTLGSSAASAGLVTNSHLTTAGEGHFHVEATTGQQSAYYTGNATTTTGAAAPEYTNQVVTGRAQENYSSLYGHTAQPESSAQDEQPRESPDSSHSLASFPVIASPERGKWEEEGPLDHVGDQEAYSRGNNNASSTGGAASFSDNPPSGTKLRSPLTTATSTASPLYAPVTRSRAGGVDYSRNMGASLHAPPPQLATHDDDAGLSPPGAPQGTLGGGSTLRSGSTSSTLPHELQGNNTDTSFGGKSTNLISHSSPMPHGSPTDEPMRRTRIRAVKKPSLVLNYTTSPMDEGGSSLRGRCDDEISNNERTLKVSPPRGALLAAAVGVNVFGTDSGIASVQSCEDNIVRPQGLPTTTSTILGRYDRHANSSPRVLSSLEVMRSGPEIDDEVNIHQPEEETASTIAQDHNVALNGGGEGGSSSGLKDADAAHEVAEASEEREDAKRLFSATTSSSESSSESKRPDDSSLFENNPLDSSWGSNSVAPLLMNLSTQQQQLQLASSREEHLASSREDFVDAGAIKNGGTGSSPASGGGRNGEQRSSELDETTHTSEAAAIDLLQMGDQYRPSRPAGSHYDEGAKSEAQKLEDVDSRHPKRKKEAAIDNDNHVLASTEQVRHQKGEATAPIRGGRKRQLSLETTYFDVNTAHAWPVEDVKAASHGATAGEEPQKSEGGEESAPAAALGALHNNGTDPLSPRSIGDDVNRDLDFSPTSRPRLISPTKQNFEKRVLKMNHSLSSPGDHSASSPEATGPKDLELMRMTRTGGQLEEEQEISGNTKNRDGAEAPGASKTPLERDAQDASRGAVGAGYEEADPGGDEHIPRGIFECTSSKETLHLTTKRNKTMEGKIFRWIKGDPLGCGSLGTAFRAFDVSTGQMLAVKEISLQDATEETRLSLQQELDSYKNLKHPSIVSYLGHEVLRDHQTSDSSSLYIYLEYMAGGSLASVVSTFGALDEPLIATYSLQLLSGLHYLHGRNFIHRDVKGANILVGLDCRVKLSDFGCAKHIIGRGRQRESLENPMESQDPIVYNNMRGSSAYNTMSVCAQTMTGSVPWMAPEVIRGDGYGMKADIWSLGCVVVEMATGKPPWGENAFDNNVAAMIKIAMTDAVPEIPSESHSACCQAFLNQCLIRRAHERPSAKALLAHEFVQNAHPGGGLPIFVQE